MPSVRDLPAVRVTNGWRVFYVYNADGLLLGQFGAYHEEAARREFSASHGYPLETLKAETKKRAE
jgi:hypothetical protein